MKRPVLKMLTVGSPVLSILRSWGHERYRAIGVRAEKQLRKLITSKRPRLVPGPKGA